MSNDSPPASDAADLPVPADAARTYIHVRPSKDSLSTVSVEQHVRRLHQLPPSPNSRHLASLFQRTPDPPTIECLLRSQPDATHPLSYAFSIDDEETVDALERLLRGLFPDIYELSRQVQPETHLTQFGSEVASITAVEFCGKPERRTDWQTQLTPFNEFIDDDQRRIPLANLVEVMADADCPMIYQTLV